MLRRLGSATPAQLGKWCAIALILVTPGSFVVLPALWLARNWHHVRRSKAGLTGAS